MGITFKISRIGARFRHKVQLENDDEDDNVIASSKDGGRVAGNNDSTSTSVRKPKVNTICRAGDDTEIPDCEVSFVLSLFPDSYSVTKPSVNEPGNQDSQKFLRHYDRASEILTMAIERGQLPADILGDIPLKYVNGAIFCEVRDYRKCTPEVGTTMPSSSLSPIIKKVRLKMSLANVVKDLPLISDDTWTYGDMMEVESRILRALEPKLCLDPTPKLGRLCANPIINKLDLDISSIRRKRLKQIQDTINTSNCLLNGKNGYTDRVPESSISRLGESGLTSIMPQHANENISTQNVNSIPNMMTSRIKNGVTDPSTTLLPLTTQQSQQHQIGMANQRLMMQENNVPGALMNVPGASPVNQEMIYSYANNIANVHGKRDYQDGPNSHLNSINKRMRGTVANAEAAQQQQIGHHMDNLQASNIQWKNPRGGIQYQNSSGTQKYPQQIYEDALALNNGGQPGMRLIAKEEPIEMERFDKQETNPNKTEMQQRLPPQHLFMRSNFQQTPWNNLGQPHEMSTRKDEQSQKRKTAPSTRISVGGFPPSPLSSKSGEFSSGSMGHQFGPAVTSSLAVSQKDKSAVNSKPTAGGGATSSDSLQRQAHIVAKRRPNSQPKNSAISGVGSPASVGNMSIVPHSASSPPVGPSVSVDPQLIERLTKIDMLSTRFKLHLKTNNKGVESYQVRNPGKFPTEHVSAFLSNDINCEFPRDETCTMPLSKSLIGGNLNVNKIRVLNFIEPECNLQGDGFPAVPRTRTRMIMSEKSNDGMIAMHFGDIECNEFLAAEEYLPTLPNAHYADLLATELCSQMRQDGYRVEDYLQIKPPNRTNHPLSNPPNTTPGTPSWNPLIEIQKNPDSVFGQLATESPKPTKSGNTTTKMLPPLNTQPLQISQGLLQSASLPSRPPQQADTQPSSLQQLQPAMTQHPSIQQPVSQFQRSSSIMLPGNSNTLMSQMNANPQMGNNPMTYNKPSSIQLQMMQQQQQQQQQQTPQLQRKMMMGLGPAANSISGLGGIGNVMGMVGVGGGSGGGQRGMGVGPTVMSSQMGQISGMGNNVAQNPMSLGQAPNIGLRTGQLTPTQAQLMAKLRMAQNRANMLAVTGGPQAAGARQMHHPGSTTSTGLQMLGQTPNRGNLNPNQNRSAIMGPPKMMPGMNMYMNPQQQFQHQQQLQFQQLHQLQQQQLQPQQQQESTITAPLQAALTAASSPQVVGSSPSTMSMNQQPASSQQMQQPASSQQMQQPTSSQQMQQQVSSQLMQQQVSSQQMQQQVSSQQMQQVSLQQMQQQVSLQQMQQQASSQQMQQQASSQQMQQQASSQQMQQQASSQQMLQMQQQASSQQMQQQASSQQMQQQVSSHQMQQQASLQQMQQQASLQQMQQQASLLMQQQASLLMQQQASSQQMNQRTNQMSPQLSSGSMMHPLLSPGNVEASCSPPPPLNNNNSSSVELQGGANRTNSTNIG